MAAPMMPAPPEKSDVAPSDVARVYGLDALPLLAAALSAALRPGLAIGLNGDLGAGKTSLVRAMLGALDYKGDVPSPSFALVQPYAPPEIRLPVLHVDLYRLNDAEDIAELGLADAMQDHVLLIEWPERLHHCPGAGINLAHMPQLFIAAETADSRKFSFDTHEFWNEVKWPNL
jgi:tRNA threonylcarbamoyladenosine biosynthesis protein TsaE